MSKVTQAGPLFDAFLDRVREMGPVGVSLVEAFDEEALSALALAQSHGFVRAYLVGNVARVRDAMGHLNAPLHDAVFVPAKTPEESAALGVSLVKEGKCRIVMKGKVGTSDRKSVV